MKVSGIDNTNFKGVTVIKSKEAKFINLLNDVDYYVLRKEKNPNVRFDAPAQGATHNGYWSGVLAYGKDAKYISAADTHTAEKKEIKSIKDVLEIPQLKKFKTEIKKYYDKFTNK